MNTELSERFSEAIEEVARDHAREIGFDMKRERHALFRMMMIVLSSSELRAKAISLLKEELEGE